MNRTRYLASRCSKELKAQRFFSSTARRREIRNVAQLSDRIIPKYEESNDSDLLSLKWPSPPQNILMIKKNQSREATESIITYAKHIHSNYDNVSLIFEPHVADEIESELPFPIFTSSNVSEIPHKVDMTTTLGGDGTILHASSLFATMPQVPPMLSFSMGTLGFLGEWKFSKHKQAFREVYMSGLNRSSPVFQDMAKKADEAETITGWSSIRGRSMGDGREAKVLLRSRLKVGVYDADGNRVIEQNAEESAGLDVHAMNEVIIHRGKEPHLAIIEVLVGGRFLTEAVADGMIVSTPTGSTAYSLSSGGSIIHPLVSSLMLTPICPRSLSFRPLVLPANTPITLRLSAKNRGREIEVSVDGRRRSRGIGVGMEIRVEGEDVKGKEEDWRGGVPCVMRVAKCGRGEDDGWVGGLNTLLKFNYPFGEEA